MIHSITSEILIKNPIVSKSFYPVVICVSSLQQKNFAPVFFHSQTTSENSKLAFSKGHLESNEKRALSLKQLGTTGQYNGTLILIEAVRAKGQILKAFRYLILLNVQPIKRNQWELGILMPFKNLALSSSSSSVIIQLAIYELCHYSRCPEMWLTFWCTIKSNELAEAKYLWRTFI